jgi:hypothetical protein
VERSFPTRATTSHDAWIVARSIWARYIGNHAGSLWSSTQQLSSTAYGGLHVIMELSQTQTFDAEDMLSILTTFA